jgi:hypothetical protein
MHIVDVTWTQRRFPVFCAHRIACLLLFVVSMRSLLGTWERNTVSATRVVSSASNMQNSTSSTPAALCW